MKISELIAQLTYCQEKFGDIEVVAYKNGRYLESVEKLVHLEAVKNVGSPDQKAPAEERLRWAADPQLQPNSGWLALPIKGLDAANLSADTRHRKLYIGPKVVCTT